MTPFAIAGIQMHVIHQVNLDGMEGMLDKLMTMYPWIQMVVFSELCPFGSSRDFVQELPGSAEQRFQARS